MIELQRGRGTVNGTEIRTSDSAAIRAESAIAITARDAAALVLVVMAAAPD